MIEPKSRSSTRSRALTIGPAMMMEDFEIGAILQAIMMYPRREEDAKFREAFIALCAAFAAEQVRSVPEYAAMLREVRPEYFSIEPAIYRATLRKAVILSRRRALAALMARAFVGQALFGEAYVLPPGLEKLSPTSVAADVAAYHRITPRENLVQRAWRPSLPILPLAIGFDNALMKREPARVRKQDDDDDDLIEPEVFGFDLQDIDLCREAVLLGQQAANIVGNDQRIAIAASDIIAIHWCE
jgi:hypothetical protein